MQERYNYFDYAYRSVGLASFFAFFILPIFRIASLLVCGSLALSVIYFSEIYKWLLQNCWFFLFFSFQTFLKPENSPEFQRLWRCGFLEHRESGVEPWVVTVKRKAYKKRSSSVNRDRWLLFESIRLRLLETRRVRASSPTRQQTPVAVFWLLLLLLRCSAPEVRTEYRLVPGCLVVRFPRRRYE